MSNFNENLKAIRRENGLSQAELAKKLNLADTSVSAYELSKNEPTIETLKNMSKLFNVSIDELVGNDFDDGFTPTVKELRKLVTKLSDSYSTQTLFYVKSLLQYQNNQI